MNPQRLVNAGLQGLHGRALLKARGQKSYRRQRRMIGGASIIGATDRDENISLLRQPALFPVDQFDDRLQTG